MYKIDRRGGEGFKNRILGRPLQKRYQILNGSALYPQIKITVNQQLIFIYLG